MRELNLEQKPRCVKYRPKFHDLHFKNPVHEVITT